jgi:hypothetical protein
MIQIVVLKSGSVAKTNDCLYFNLKILSELPMHSTKPAAFGEFILQCVRWYCKYGISYRDLEEMMSERGLEIDHTTLYRWVQHYA